MGQKTLSDLFQKEAPGLTPLAVAVFMIIAGRGKISFKSLGKELEVPQANILRAIAALEGDHGLVFVEEKASLKKIAGLTKKGQNLAQEIISVASLENPSKAPK